MGLAYFCAERCALCAFVARNRAVPRRIADNLSLFVGCTVYYLSAVRYALRLRQVRLSARFLQGRGVFFIRRGK